MQSADDVRVIPVNALQDGVQVNIDKFITDRKENLRQNFNKNFVENVRLQQYKAVPYETLLAADLKVNPDLSMEGAIKIPSKKMKPKVLDTKTLYEASTHQTTI